MSLHPYLFFTGTCRQAMTRHHEVLGGRLDIMTVGDMPAGAEPPPGPRFGTAWMVNVEGEEVQG